jgi:23S rRNA (adenine2030-N6)-methyltransferase
MLSYQHMYHAGNPADVHKHLVLSALLGKLAEKPRPVTYMETHAGRGLYDLSSPEALKTGEAAYGILRIEKEGGFPKDDAHFGPAFQKALAETRRLWGGNAYPGSPLIAQMLLRPGDPLHLMELHPEEHRMLKGAMQGKNVHIHRRDGFEGVLAMSPPEKRRGLVLVDPSYEVKTEYGVVADFAGRLLAKWPQAVVMIWYPILPAGLHEGLVAGMPAAAFRHEIRFSTPHSERGMRGSGVIVLNMPYGQAAPIARWAWPFAGPAA